MDTMGAFIVGAIIAGVTAIATIWGVITQRVIARRHATINFISKAEADTDIIKARRKFTELANKLDGGLAKFAEKDHEGTEDATQIALVLNQFELIAIGVQKGVFDFTIYKRWNKSTVLRYWNHAAPFVHALRARIGNDGLYHEFEQMAWWLKEKKMPKRNRFTGLFF